MSQVSIIEVSVGVVNIKLETGSRTLANMFGVYLKDSRDPEYYREEQKFSGEQAYGMAMEHLVSYLRIGPRDKDINYILDKIEEGYADWKRDREDFKERGNEFDLPFHLYITIAVQK